MSGNSFARKCAEATVAFAEAQRDLNLSSTFPATQKHGRPAEAHNIRQGSKTPAQKRQFLPQKLSRKSRWKRLFPPGNRTRHMRFRPHSRKICAVLWQSGLRAGLPDLTSRWPRWPLLHLLCPPWPSRAKGRPRSSKLAKALPWSALSMSVGVPALQIPVKTVLLKVSKASWQPASALSVRGRRQSLLPLHAALVHPC